MAENFDLIFGQSAGSQYAWSESDYQNGWETVGNTPPTAQQFDALQRRSDLKAQELNNALTPLVNANQTDNRQPSTTYSEGDIKYSPLLPTGWFLACTVSGMSSASELVVPSPVEEGDEITDGGVTWKIKKIGGAGDAGDGVPLGAIIAYSANGELPSGYLLCDGSAVSRTMFPDLFAAIGTTYGAGDGSTTFNLPNYADGKFPEGSTVAGTVKQPGLPNIEGYAGLCDDSDFYRVRGVSPSGAFYTKSITANGMNSAATSPTTFNEAGYFDASKSNSIYGSSDTVQPYSLTTRYIIKAYDGVTPTPSEADISEMLTELTGKADRSLSNLTQTAKDLITNSCAPDYNSILSNVGNNYTAPTNGIYYFSILTINNARTISVNGTDLTNIYNSYGSSGGIPIILGKGDTVNVSNGATLLYSYFVPMKGAL